MNRSYVIGALVFIGLLVLYSSVVFVDETDHILITQFGKPRRVLSEPGLQWKAPFVETASRMEKRILASDASPEEYLTQDKKRLVADPITRWRIVDPLLYYEAIGDELSAQTRLDDLVRSELKGKLAEKDMSDMVGNARGDMMQDVTLAVRKQAKEYGIDVVDVRIKRLDLPKEVQQSVFSRMEAERKRLAKKYRAEGQEQSDEITSATDRDQRIEIVTARATAELLRGEGDAESTKIYAEAYGQDPEFYAFVRNLEAYEKSIDGKSTMVLSTGSDVFRYLTKPGKALRTTNPE